MLTQTDARILTVPPEGKNVTGNIADRTDNNLDYVTKRLRKELVPARNVEYVGPESRSRYQITDDGREALNAFKLLHQKRKQQQAGPASPGEVK